MKLLRLYDLLIALRKKKISYQEIINQINVNEHQLEELIFTGINNSLFECKLDSFKKNIFVKKIKNKFINEEGL